MYASHGDPRAPLARPSHGAEPMNGMRRLHAWAGAFTLASLLGAAAAGAQTSVPVAPVAPAPTPVDTDRSAVVTIVQHSVSEMQLCRVAVEKSQNADIRSFCRGLDTDHARTALAGVQLAQKLGATDVTLAPSPDTPAVIEALGRYSGHAFDREFFLTQIEDHENDQDALRYAAEVADNSTVKQYEDSVLPRVQKYLQLAETALHEIGAGDP